MARQATPARSSRGATASASVMSVDTASDLPRDAVVGQRRNAVEPDAAVGGGVGASGQDVDPVTFRQRQREMVGVFLVEHVGRVAGRSGEGDRTVAVPSCGSGSGWPRPSSPRVRGVRRRRGTPSAPRPLVSGATPTRPRCADTSIGDHVAAPVQSSALAGRRGTTASRPGALLIRTTRWRVSPPCRC